MSLPLIQIGMGVIIALVAPSAIRIELNPDLFLVAFIAPLLYDEARHADKELLWRDRKPILSLAIGLVIATTLAIGFAVNAVIPRSGSPPRSPSARRSALRTPSPCPRWRKKSTSPSARRAS